MDLSHSTKPICQEILIKHIYTFAIQTDLCVAPRIFDFCHIGILPANVHTADITYLVVDSDDFAVTAVMGKIGLYPNQFTTGIEQWLEHFLRGGEIGYKITQYQNFYSRGSFFGKYRYQSLSYFVMVNGIELYVNTLFRTSDIRKKLPVMLLTIGI